MTFQDLMHKAGLHTYAAVAQKSEVHRDTLRNMLEGDNEPNVSTVRKVAAALGVEVQDLLAVLPQRDAAAR